MLMTRYACCTLDVVPLLVEYFSTVRPRHNTFVIVLPNQPLDVPDDALVHRYELLVSIFHNVVRDQ